MPNLLNWLIGYWLQSKINVLDIKSHTALRKGVLEKRVRVMGLLLMI